MVSSRLRGAVRLVWSILSCVLASSGFRPDNIGWTSTITLALAVAGYWAHQTWFAVGATGNDATRVYAYFGALFAIRYLYLFTSFVRGGIADRLIGRFGEERGYRLYEIGTAWMFFQRGLTFAPLVALHPWSLLAPLHLDAGAHATLKALCIGAGALLVLIGFVVNTSATLVVGFDVYYYKDLFLRRAVGSFEVRGPYRYLANPMYGLGQCSGYGAALMLGSVEGLLATLVNQLCMYAFYYAVEKPHIAALFSPQTRPATADEVAPISAVLRKGSATVGLSLLFLLPAGDARAFQREAPSHALAAYSAIGVGVAADGLVHEASGALRLDVGMGEACVGMNLPGEVGPEVGYQYGGNLFVGWSGSSWSARVGAKPDSRAWRFGVGYGSPLLPLPSVVTAAAADAYPRVERALSDESLLHAVLAALGPVADAVAATPMETLSVGIQLGFEPEGIGLYGFAGAASPI